MPATSSKHSTFVPDLQEAGERFRQAGDRWLEVSRKVAHAYLDGTERYFDGVAQFERRLGEQSTVEPVASFLTAHAKLTEDVTHSSFAAFRELLAV